MIEARKINRDEVLNCQSCGKYLSQPHLYPYHSILDCNLYEYSVSYGAGATLLRLCDNCVGAFSELINQQIIEFEQRKDKEEN